MRLTDAVLNKVKQAGVTVYFADRRLTKIWNRDRTEGDPAHFGGWYWHRARGRQIIDMDTSGPFKTQSAALRDAYIRLQLSVDIRHGKVG